MWHSASCYTHCTFMQYSLPAIQIGSVRKPDKYGRRTELILLKTQLLSSISLLICKKKSIFACFCAPRREFEVEHKYLEY